MKVNDSKKGSFPITLVQAEKMIKADIEKSPTLSVIIHHPESDPVNLPPPSSVSSGVCCDNLGLCRVSCQGEWYRLVKLGTYPTQYWKCNEIRNTPTGIYYEWKNQNYTVVL